MSKKLIIGALVLTGIGVAYYMYQKKQETAGKTSNCCGK